MDIFPRANETDRMHNRRAILASALRIVGVALGTPMLAASSPYVRLEGERGSTTDERDRFTEEIERLSADLLNLPASTTMPAILATWANLDQFRYSTGSDVSAFKAKLAILAGANSITLNDPGNGSYWFDAAHRYARLAKDTELISLAHSRAALAGLYWGLPITQVTADAYLGFKRAPTPGMKGMGEGIFARVAAQSGLRTVAMQHGEQAIERAGNNSAPPRVDRWDAASAHSMLSRALCRYSIMLPNVEAHSRAAEEGFPTESFLSRSHARLNIAEVHASGREYDGAASVIMGMFNSIPKRQFEPVLMGRISDIAQRAEQRDPKNAGMEPVRQRLAEYYSA